MEHTLSFKPYVQMELIRILMENEENLGNSHIRVSANRTEITLKKIQNTKTSPTVASKRR